ncbi:hypothetical protein AMAG_08865 [Allomyces macrogynus ATCC 38327]|uniref:Uncharacterized protein n=1 Tax=Allomyces macrogynus (strain ATCC 38327) TaxID=578462 RepID=A0A0L0SMS8_ALLM3|nr:hypothetical protein AMAG_08865 [Allomyces macrogynus ATCC 38327]|eukprot:KNE63788.1 hypothetical protein AMAG_08865 [Allomyces macrogynus ATCC 38327]
MLGVSDSVKYVQDLGKVVDPCYIPGSPAELNNDAKYDVVFTSTVDDTDAKAATFSAAAVDAAPLNRAEWLKFVSYFFNRELDAATTYQRMADQYACRKAQIASADPKPTIAWIEKISENAWAVSNGAFARTLLADAGAVPMAARSEVDQTQLMEVLKNSHAVIDVTARDGEWNLSLWLKMFGISSVSETPYKFVRNRKIYLADRRHSTNGTNAFPTESTQLVNFLHQDLISIFYPPAQHTYFTRFIRHIDDGYTTPSGTCSAADLFPNNAKECDGGAKPDKYTAGSSILTGSDAASSSSSSSSGTTQESSTSTSSGTSVGTIIVVVLVVVGVAAVGVFVAPGMMRKYRERKNQAYMREML